MADIQLFYFGIRVRAEFTRLLLHAAGQKFDDNRMPRPSWGPDGKAETPYGQVPYMIYKGKKYGQSLAIASFFARKLGYYGTTEEDSLRVDEVVQLCEELRVKVIEWIRAKDKDKKAELAQKLKDELAPRYFEALLVDNRASGFFVGDSASLADFVIYDMVDTVLGIDPEALTAFPNLRKLRSNVEEIPTLQQYLSQRPKTTY